MKTKMNRAQDAAQRQTFFTFEAKKLLELSSAKLTALSIGLLLAVFCTIGMSFRPVYDEQEASEIVMSGPRRSHWTTSGSCGGTTHHNKTDYARTVAQSMNVDYGTVAITANTKKATPVTATDGSQSYVDWDTGLGTSETTNQRNDLETIHTNVITFSATPTDPEEYYFVGWYSDAKGNTQVSTDNPWEDVEVKFPDQAGFTSYKSSSGVTTYESSSSRYTVTYYAKFAQIPAINVTFLAASTPARDNGYYTVAGKGVSGTITTSNQTIGVKGITLTAYASEMAEFVRWYTEDGAGNRTTLSEENPCVTSFTAATKVGVEWRELTNNHKITFLSTDVDANGDPVGSYTVDAQTVNTSNYVYNTGDAYKYSPTLTAAPASGYMFTGWYTKHGKKKDLLSTSNPWNPTFTQDSTIYAGFAYNNYTDDQKAQFKVGSTYYTDLNAANAAASSGSNKTIICTRDGVLPPGNYTISSGVKLYIPYSESETLQTRPTVVTSAETLTANRTLVFADGANVACYGTIGLGGKIMAGSGGSKSGYVTGPCGMIDMSRGGHIELYDGSIIYAWGLIKGQDMDQGNNTLDVGTITANSGAVIWEDFAIGDWRGGTATSNIKDKQSSWKLFPFQSYSVQNIEIPVTYRNNSKLSIYTTLNTSYGDYDADLSLIGNSNTLFLMKDKKSVVRKWYDPTSDLSCYELSGTAVMDALDVNISGIVTVNSGDFYLPISNSMHVILSDCNMTLSKPMTMQAGSVVEIKNNATLNLEARLHMFDKDEWGLYIHNYYFRSFNNLTNHKNRGAENSNEGLEDAKLIVDGRLNVVSGKGYIYATNGGANIMGNGGGTITFGGALPTSTTIHNVTVGTKAQGYIVDAPDAINYANLHNEDDSYTQSIASTTFYNIHGRWFTADDKDEKENHTYKFTYITSGAVSGDGGTSDWTPAVYSWDKKAALDLTQKWHNVTADACSNWWVGTDTYFYNWTESSDWHQFIPTATEGMYSGSNNKIYTKTDCVWEELGETDVNCLYTIGGIKKALVDGEFIALEPNNNDPAYHAADDATKYYICFSGCNWHEATKYENAEKAYVVDEDIFIWYDGAWMNAEWKEPFFYTLDETDVPVYYEYLNGEWVLSDPYIRVIDGLENRTYWFLDEAFAFAAGSLRTSPTIKILRDISSITTAVSYTGANKTCTLDLNGHTITGDVSNMITVNASGCTFTIEDNSANEDGKINLVFSANNSRRRALYVQKGHVILNSGTIASTNTLAYSSTNTKPYAEGLLVANGHKFTMNGGRVEVSSAYNPYGIEGASGTPTININGGTIETVAETRDSPYAVFGYGTINVKGGTINAIAKASSSAMGVYVYGSSSYQGTANISGGTILARATSSAQGARCWGSATVTADYSAETPDNTPKARYYANLNITGGTITAECTTSTTSYGVLSYGTTVISGGTITSTVQKSNQNTAYGVYTVGGTTTISAGANITANAPTKAYGVTVTGANGDSNRGWPHVGVVNITGGTITANTTNTTTAYGLLVTGATWTINKTNGYSVFNGDYASAGTATVSGGTFNANAKTTLSRGIAVAATQTKNAASATPKCTINGGYYKMTGTGDVLGCNASALPADFQINGGYYSHEGNLATYAVSPKQVLTLASGDANRPPYYYKVAEAYQVTFKNEDGTANIIDPVYQEVGTAPVCSTEPTKESTSTNSFTFDGWATEANGAKVYEPNGLPNVTSAGATYYAHFATTTLKYRVHFDAATNGGECATENIYVNPGTAVGSLPAATKYGYKFNGWFTAATGGTQLATTTVINADADYYAQFTANSHTLTWDLGGGKVSTAGKIGSTTWPAQNATGTQSKSVAYGTILTTIPVVTKTGYTFNRWNPVPTSSMPDEDVTYTALWNPNTNTKYTVKHYLQNVDGTYPTEPTETETLTGTTAVSVTPAVKSYEGFISPATQTKTIAADGKMVVEYQYRRIPYTIEWNAYTNGGTCATPSSTVLYGATLGSMPTAIKTGFRLDGWFTQAVGGVQITGTTPIMQNYGTLYAQFTEVPTYRVTFNANGHGTAPDAQDIVSGEKAAEPAAPSEKGYTFGGWYKEDACTNAWNFASDFVMKDMTLYAKWTPNTNTAYTVKHFKQKLDGTYPVEADETENETGTTAVEVTPAVKAYTGFDAPSTQTKAIAANGSMVIEYKYTRKSYTLTWNANDGTISGNAHTSGNVKFEAPITAPENANVTRTGYSFKEWTPTPAATMPAAETTYTAQWTPVNYTVTFDFPEGTGGSASVTATFDAAMPDITAPTRIGYTFAGYYTETNGGGTQYYTATGASAHKWDIAEDKTLYAKWEPNTNTKYTVKHMREALDGTYPEGLTETENKTGTTATKVAPDTKTYEGFTAPSRQTNTIAADGSMVIEYKYTRNSYALAWEANGGTISGDVHTSGDVKFEAPITAPANANVTRTGYSFNGWNTTLAPTMPAAETTYTAQWTPVNYTVTFDFPEGTGGSASVTATFDAAMPDITAPTRIGYTFAGYYTETNGGGTQYYTATGASAHKWDIASDKTLYAKWEPNTKTPYTVEHYQQNIEDVYYTRYETENLTGTTDAEITPEPKNYTGFDAPSAQTVTIQADGTLVVKYYYNRETYTVTWWDAQEILDNHLIEEQTYKYGATPSYTYDKPRDENYTYEFIRWTPAIEPVTGNMTYTAVYSAKADNKEVSTAETITTDLVAGVTTIHTSGQLNIPTDKSLTTTDFVLEATADASGELIGNVAAENIYFDLFIHDTESRHWHAFTVPFVVNLKKKEGKPIQINGETLTLGRGYDIVYYDGAERAASGKSAKCWKYVEEEGDSILHPGKAYMIASASRAIDVVRFTKYDDEETRISISKNASSTGVDNDGGWNGIGNPKMYHAVLEETGATVCQVHDGGRIGADGYDMYDLKERKLVVGKAVYVQVKADKDEVSVVAATDGQDIIKPKPSSAPSKNKADRMSGRYDVHIAPADGEMADHIYLLADEEKEDKYVILADLAKAGVSPVRAQMWVDRYDDQLCMNTAVLVNNQADYPLGISVPNAGEYDIYIAAQPEEDAVMYLTLDGKPVWNLSYGGYTATLEKGTTNRYGLRLVKKSSKIPTGMEELTIENGGAVRKVLVNDKVYIIRNGETYTITGQMVK